MAIAQVSLSDVKLTSTWKCYQSGSNYISTTPKEVSTEQTVQLNLPAGSAINSAVLTYTIDGAPNTGAELCTVNGVAAGWRTGNHSVSIPITGAGANVIRFAFRAYGSSHQHVQSHSAVLGMRQMVLTVDYTEPYAPSDWAITTPSVDAGNAVSVTISPKGGGYTHHLRLDFGGYAAEQSLAEGVNVASLPTSLEWLRAIPNATSGVGNITLTTYYGGTWIGQSTKSVTITAPVSAAPTLEAAVTRVLTVGGVTYPDVTGGYVQQKSAAKADITAASGAYGSTITGYSINIGGKSDAAYNSAGTSLTSPLLPDAGEIPVTFRVTDSRGRTVQKIVTIQVEAYAPPRATRFTVYRADADGNTDDNGTRGRYEFQKVYTSLGGKNSCTASIAAAGSEAQNIAEQGWIVPGAVKELDVLLAYEVYLTLSDAYGDVMVTETIPSINFAIHFSADGTAVWVGESCQHDNAFGVAPGRNVYFYGQELKELIKNNPPGELRVDGNTALWAFATAIDGYGFQAGTPGSGCEFNLARMNGNSPVVMWVNGGNQNGAIYTEGNPPSALNYWPVGSVYISVVSTSPAALFGGGWERLPLDCFLMSTWDGNAGATGGSFWYNLVANIGTANADYSVWAYNETSASAYQVNHLPLASLGFQAKAVPSFSHWSHSTVVSQADANNASTFIAPPYYAVYMWRRIS